MSEHTVTSPTWGPLRVEATPKPDEHGRAWTALLIDGPARLSWLLAVHDDPEEDVIAHLAPKR